MSIGAVFPWQHNIWQLLVQSRARQTLPHAFIFSGLQGVGKSHFTHVLSAWLLCQQPTELGACGQCKSCQLWQAESHPDYRLLEAITDEKTGKTSRVIKVDQVREVVGFLNKSAQLNGYRVVVIQPADILNINAANSLLKTLEEPGDKIAIILLTDQPLALLPTIRSRCQHFALSVPSLEQAKQWLEPQLKKPEQAGLLLALTDNAPLAALALQDAAWFQVRAELAQSILAVSEKKSSPLQTSQQWQKNLKADELLIALVLLLADVLLMSLGQENAIKNSDLLPIIRLLAKRLADKHVFELHEYCLDSQRLVSANIQANLLLDNFWQRLQ